MVRGDSFVWHPFTSYPIDLKQALLTRAQGAFVYDDKGNRLFDATSSWWCNIHGHCNPRLVEALKRQAETLDQVMFAPHAHAVGLELAERLVGLLGPPFSRVFYSDDGSTAVESALKMTIQFWKKRDPNRRYFLTLDHSYHGDTMGAVSVGNTSEFHSQFGRVLESFKLSLTDLESDLSLIRERGKQCAAIILEPLVLGAGGMVFYPKEYLEAIHREAVSQGMLVIYDEVFTGFGRTGTMFAMEATKLRPDIICLSKGLTSGMLPLAATVVTDEVFKSFVGKENTFFHGHTFTANPLGAAVALESLKIFEEDKVIEKNRNLSDLMARQVSRFQSMDHVSNARSLGMIWAIDLVKDQKSKEYFNPANGPGWKIAQSLWSEGIWLRPLGQVLYCIPPYCSKRDDLQRFFDLLYSALSQESFFEE